jgi:hypothetical protein
MKLPLTDRQTHIHTIRNRIMRSKIWYFRKKKWILKLNGNKIRFCTLGKVF